MPGDLFSQGERAEVSRPIKILVVDEESGDFAGSPSGLGRSGI